MSVEFVRREVPPEIWDAVEPLLFQFAYLVPTWCHQVNVFYSAECQNSAECKAFYEYRNAQVVIGAPFLRGPHGDRVETIRHEFLHLPIAPMTDWTKDLIHRLAGEDERLRDWLLSEWRERFEGAVCDLEKATR